MGGGKFIIKYLLRDTGTFALAAKCWLAIGRGTEAGECLARLGDRAAVRLAAVVTGELVWCCPCCHLSPSWYRPVNYRTMYADLLEIYQRV